MENLFNVAEMKETVTGASEQIHFPIQTDFHLKSPFHFVKSFN